MGKDKRQRHRFRLLFSKKPREVASQTFSNTSGSDDRQQAKSLQERFADLKLFFHFANIYQGVL